MARHSQEAPPPSRFRAFTTSLGFKPATPRSSSDQSSTPSLTQRAVSTSSSARSLFGTFTLYLRVHSAQNLPVMAQSSYCKLYLGESPIIGGFGQSKSFVGVDKSLGSSHQTFHTKVQAGASRDSPEWNEKFQLSVRNPNTEVLTIRVKSHVLLYSPAVGACVVHLRQLQLGATTDEWFPLYKNDKATGQIRLQICLHENVPMPVPKRRYSQPSEEMIQRLMQEHRELEEAKRREVEMQQEEKWRKMEDDTIKHVGLKEQMEREEKWRQQCAKREAEQQSQSEDSDLDLPPSFKYRNGKAEEAEATLLMGDLCLQAEMGEDKEGGGIEGVPSSFTINGIDSGDNTVSFTDRRTTGFGTIRLSMEELDQVVQNALPSSDSSDSTSSERQRRDEKKRSRRKRHKRQAYSDEDSSDASSVSLRGYRKGSSGPRKPESKLVKKTSTHGSVSSRSDTQNGNQNSEIPISLTFPPSPSDESSTSSSEDERRHRRHRRAEKAKNHEKERRRQSKRKLAKSRRNYDSSDSSSALSSESSSLSSSLSSSEEERLRRKLKKTRKARKAKARAKPAENGESRASLRMSSIQYRQKMGYADSRDIDYSPSVAQRREPVAAATIQASEAHHDGDASRNIPNGVVSDRDFAGSRMPPSSFVASNAQHQMYSTKGGNAYGPDGAGFDEPDQPTTQQYLGQTTKEQTNAELMRSFCF